MSSIVPGTSIAPIVLCWVRFCSCHFLVLGVASGSWVFDV